MRRPPARPLDLRSATFKDDPRPRWRALHAEADAVVLTRQPLLGRVALATRHAEASAVLGDTSRFVVDARRVDHRGAAGLRWWVPAALRPLADNMLTRDGETHRALRARVEHAFRHGSLEALQPRIEAFAEEAVERLGRDGGGGDFVASVARPVPQRVIAALLGLDGLRDGRDEALKRAVAVFSGVRGPRDLFRVLPAVRRITRLLREEIGRRRAAPEGRLLDVLVAPEGEGRALDDEELVAMIFLLYAAGHETTTHLMSTALLTVLREPVPRELLDTALPAGAVVELLRYLSPVQLSKPRFMLADTEIGGVPLRRGETIAALIGAANMDPRRIDEPYRLDLERRPARHLGFGAGPHVCLGLQLALRETRAVLAALFRRHPDIALARPETPPAWSSRLGVRVLRSLPLTGLGGARARVATADG